MRDVFGVLILIGCVLVFSMSAVWTGRRRGSSLAIDPAMKFLGMTGGELRAEHAHSALSLDEGGGESMRKGSSSRLETQDDGPAPSLAVRHVNFLNGDGPMSSNCGDPEEIPFVDEDDDEDTEAEGPRPDRQPVAAERQTDPGDAGGEEEEEEEEAAQPPVAAETSTNACQGQDGTGDREDDEECSSPTTSSDEDSQRRPAPGGDETELEEEEEQVLARSIVRCNDPPGRTRRRRTRNQAPPLGILKGTSGRVNKRRVTFNEMMTVFMDGCPEVQVPAFRPWDLTFSEVCYMYEPPPEYRDWEDAFEPPDGYKDLDGVTTFDEASCSSSSDDDRGPVPAVGQREEVETLFPMEDEDLSSGEFVVHRVTIVEPEPEMVQLNDSSDQEDELVDEPNSHSSPSAVVEDVAEEASLAQAGTDNEEEASDSIGDVVAKEIVYEETKEIPVETNEESQAEPEEQEQEEEGEKEAKEVEESSAEEVESVCSDAQLEKPVEITLEEQSDASEETKAGDTEDETPKVSRTNSQIRRSLELSALRRSLLRGETEMVSARRRRQAVPRPKSPSSSGIEEKLRWLTSTEDLTTVGDTSSPPRSVPGHTGPTRWTSELLYPSPANKTPPSVPNPQLPYYRPPSRPSSFDPHVGLIAWEGYLQQRDRTRAVYQRHVERHPNAPERPPSAAPPPRRPSNNSDELEWFVQRDSERTERIKKRYSLSEEEDPTFGFGRRPSVRGIRPRFGSTTEILQQLQSQLQKRPPPPPNCLLYSSLPRNASTGNMPYMPYPDLVARLPKVNEESIKRRPAGEPINITRTTGSNDGRSPEAPAVSNQKCFACKDERGAPEGASSSPKMSTDSLYAAGSNTKTGTSAQQQQESAKEDVVVYYSLRV